MFSPVYNIIFDCPVAQDYIKAEENQCHEQNADIQDHYGGTINKQSKNLMVNSTDSFNRVWAKKTALSARWTIFVLAEAQYLSNLCTLLYLRNG